MKKYIEDDCFNNDIIHDIEDDEDLEILNEIEDEEDDDGKEDNINNITNLPYRGTDSDDDYLDIIDSDVIIIEDDYPDFKPSTGKGFTTNDLSRKIRKSLANAGLDIKELSQDEIEALVGYDANYGDNNLLDPYVFLQSYRRKNKKINEDIGTESERVQAYYDTLELMGDYFKGSNNKRIVQLISQLLNEIQPYTNM